MLQKHTIYFAGELFDHKDLVGNSRLAQAVTELSGNKYQCVLPQELDFSGMGPKEMRNKCFETLMDCGLGLFNFDGLELDSGTVAEFMTAKFLDIPAVIIRSDLRGGGDQGDKGDSWNLMLSGYPRTEILRIDAMALWKEAADEASFYGKFAQLLIEKFDRIISSPALLDDEERSKARASAHILTGMSS